MKKQYLLAAAALIGAIVAVPIVTVPSAPAMAQSFAFSFDSGNVRMGYRDGYYDHRGYWHSWRSAREARMFRERYRDRYRGMYRDEDRDGTPDRYDRDRDGDGVPNRFDSRPNNPYRN